MPASTTIALHKFPRYHFRCVDSTNSTAAGFLEKMPFPGVIITADEQLAGRGRLGRSWNSEESANLYFSLGIRHNGVTTMQQITLLQGIGALATLHTIHSIIADHLRPTIFLKYPNDVVAIAPENKALRKIAGILVENTFSGSSCTMSIIGIGVNLQQQQFPKELEEKALSLVQLGCDVMPITFADKLEKMLQILLTAPVEHVLEQWQKALRLPGLPVKIVGDTTPYVAQHLTPESTLVVTTPDGSTRFINDGDSLVYEL